MLRDRLAVSARRVCEHCFFRKHTLYDIGVRPRGVELQKLKAFACADSVRRNAADDYFRSRYLIVGHGVCADICKFAVLTRTLKLFLVSLRNGKNTKHLFRHNASPFLNFCLN